MTHRLNGGRPVLEDAEATRERVALEASIADVLAYFRGPEPRPQPRHFARGFLCDVSVRGWLIGTFWAGGDWSAVPLYQTTRAGAAWLDGYIAHHKGRR